MKILIDGDSCPVIDITQKIAYEYELELITFSDYNHNLTLNYGQSIKVDQSFQSVDMEILNRCDSDDIVITDDYGLASLILGKKAYPISSKGYIYTEQNIEHLLMMRHINKKIRKSGKKHTTIKKRTEQDDERFEKNLIKLINTNL